MINDKTVAVVIPAYNEMQQIGMVIDSLPDFVDRIIVVNDGSTDKTSEVVSNYISKAGQIKLPGIGMEKPKNKLYNTARKIIDKQNEEETKYFARAEIIHHNKDNRLVLIELIKNSGVGAAIAKGYKWAKEQNIDCTAVMAGDGQMDPDELESICSPVIYENVDYVKGNRLRHKGAKLIIPRTRFLGNSILSILTKIASGYWRISDTQTGYTAISKNALHSLKLYKIYKKYGMPNDLLVKLNIAFCTITEIDINPVYNIGEKSKMKAGKVAFPIFWLLIRSFFKRLWVKYLFRDFHPLFILYNFSFLLFVLSIPFGIKILRLVLIHQDANPTTVLAFMFLFISGFQSLLFAMWMDMQDNERLYK